VSNILTIKHAKRILVKETAGKARCTDRQRHRPEREPGWHDYFL